MKVFYIRLTLFQVFHFFRKIFAKTCRTFVTDCPRCHRWFFGFQRHANHVCLDDVNYRIVCHCCAVDWDKYLENEELKRQKITMEGVM